MKFTADRGTLMQTLAKTQGIADKKGTVNNVLAHVLMETVDETTIRVKCTDYDVVLISTFQANVIEPGKIALNARSFFDSIRMWQDSFVEIESLAGGTIKCRCGKTNANLMSFDPDDFPIIEKDDNEPKFELPTRVLADLSSRMTPFMSDDPSRMNLNGMLLNIEKTKEMNSETGEEEELVLITAVATDGHRMAVVERELPGLQLPFDSKKAIIHRKGILELKRLLDDNTAETASIGFANGEIIIRHGTSALFIRQIDEDYPNYKGVIPQSFQGELKINRYELVNAIKIASPIVDTHSLGIRFKLFSDQVIITGSRSDVGNVETSLFAEYEGPEMELGYNYRFVLDSLGAIDSEQILIGFTGVDSPSLMRPDSAAERSRFVIMPMEIS
jgi:DNA polymerase III subunit beta